MTLPRSAFSKKTGKTKNGEKCRVGTARRRRHPPYPAAQTPRMVGGKEFTTTLDELVNGKIEPATGTFFQGPF